MMVTKDEQTFQIMHIPHSTPQRVSCNFYPFSIIILLQLSVLPFTNNHSSFIFSFIVILILQQFYFLFSLLFWLSFAKQKLMLLLFFPFFVVIVVKFEILVSLLQNFVVLLCNEEEVMPLILWFGIGIWNDNFSFIVCLGIYKNKESNNEIYKLRKSSFLRFSEQRGRSLMMLRTPMSSCNNGK